MSISNVPSLFTKIHTGAEGGHEFARLCKMLLASDYHGHLHFLELADDSSGDFKKCDARLQLFEYGTSNKEVLLFQFKFYPSPLSAKHRNRIKTSYIEAANENPNATKWILITPDDFNKIDSGWFDQLIQDSQVELIKPNNPPQNEHWGHTQLITFLLKYKHIGVNYYPELFSQNGGFATIDKVSIDENLCSWEMSDDGNFTVFANEIDLDRFYASATELIPFDKLPKEDKQMFNVVSQVIESRSLGETNVDPVVLYKGLISKILFSYDETKLEIYKEDIDVSEDCLRKWWIKPDELNNSLATEYKYQFPSLEQFHDLFGKSSDPILNITFANRSDELVIVYNVGFNIIDIWQELGGPPSYATIVPILADVVFEIEENRKSWLKTLENAIQVPPNQAMTIKVRLKNYLDIYAVTYMVSGVFELGISTGKKIKSPTILFVS